MDVRRSAFVVALGSLLFIAGDLFDVVGLVDNLYVLPDTAARLAALEAAHSAWDLSHVVAGAGHVVAAVGLWLLGRALARAVADERSRRAATVAAWAGLATAVWVANSFEAVVRPPEDVVAALEDPTAVMIVTGIILLAALVVLFIALGVTLLRLRHLRWLGWTLVVVGPLTALSMPGVGPSLPVSFMLLPSVTLALRPVPSPEGARTGVPVTP